MANPVPDEEKTFQRALELDADERSAEAVKLLPPLIMRRDNSRYLLAYATCVNRAGGPWKEAVATPLLVAAAVLLRVANNAG